ncbi:hypothetical protein [Marinomonas spartinae]|uniref:hypothetical protein n=1 Tax=Marinomonas spartinae TaxID=1792290 RepID=UPI001C2FF26D|nr:hypothetical protein [Marinomonas spartinae]
MFFFNDMAVRIGLSTKGISLVDTIKSKIGHTVGILAGFGVFLSPYASLSGMQLVQE